MAKKVKKTKKATVKKTVTKKKVKEAVKKSTAKKKISSRKSTKKKEAKARKSALTAKELAYFRDLLIEKLKEIIGDVNHIESGALRTSRRDSAGDLSSMPIHMADIGSDNYEQEFSLGLMDSERKIVREIYDALNRIEDGTYGICEGTGEPIPKMRLEGIPWTRYTLQFAEMLEKGLAVEPDHAFMEDESDSDVDEDNMFDEDEDFDDEDDEDDDSDVFFYGYNDEEDDDEDLHEIE